MNLTKWLDGLAAAVQHKLSPLESFEYKQELETWPLSDEQWLEVKAIAKRRHEFFPRLTELELIRDEVRRKASADRPGDRPCWETVHPGDGLCYARRPQRNQRGGTSARDSTRSPSSSCSCSGSWHS
jgi:hypothetical protein